MSTDRFEELYERYCDGSLSAAERAEFVELMGDPQARTRFVEMSSFEAVVAEEARVTQGAGRESETSSIRKAASRSRLMVQRIRRGQSSRPWWPIALGAAAFLIVVTVALISSPSQSPAPVQPPAAPPVARRIIEPPVHETVERLTPATAPERPPVPGRATAPRPGRPSVPDSVVTTPAPTPPANRPVQQPRPAPAPVKSRTTEVKKPSVAVIGTLERVSGHVLIGSVQGESGRGVRSGESVSVGEGEATLRFLDGSMIEFDRETRLAKVSEDENGKRAQLERGVVWVDARPQPKGRPLVVGGSHADATVLGTSFSLKVDPEFTRLDVLEGRVRFTTASGVSSRTVSAGQYAVAGKGQAFTARARYTQWKAPTRNLVLWLRADEGLALEDGAVATWGDRSPKLQDAVQTVAAMRPCRISDAIGGKPALRFDGHDDFFKLPDGFSDFRAGLTIFVVARVGQTPGWMRFLDLGRAPGCENITFGRKDTGDKLTYWSYNKGVTRGKVEAPGAIRFDHPQTLSVVASSGGRVTLFRDGTVVGAGSTSAAPNMVRTPNYIGKSNFGGGEPLLRGDIAEIMLFNRALSDGERAYVEGYLRLKYFDPTAPPERAR